MVEVHFVPNTSIIYIFLMNNTSIIYLKPMVDYIYIYIYIYIKSELTRSSGFPIKVVLLNLAK